MPVDCAVYTGYHLSYVIHVIFMTHFHCEMHIHTEPQLSDINSTEICTSPNPFHHRFCFALVLLDHSQLCGSEFLVVKFGGANGLLGLILGPPHALPAVLAL